MQILGIGEHLGWGAAPLDAQGLPGEDFLHRYTEAARLAYADRALYVADPAFVPAPGGRWEQMLDPVYLRERAAQVGERSMGVATPGVPPAWQRAASAPRPLFAAQPAQPEGGTSHISIVDADGRALAMTTTIEAVWGARILADGGTGLPGGYLLNNQLTDFGFVPADAQGRAVANRVQPGKRPRSSMSPTIVFDRRRGEPVLVLGSALGPFIIPAVARVIVDTLERGHRLDDALAAPLVASLNGPVTVVEAGRLDEPALAALRARGHTVQPMALASGLHALQRVPGGWRAAADPRREGQVRGD
jgi:gamma-glutamyltranspeptidase/glutathione hydrolase